jgi:hypothetical protein
LGWFSFVRPSPDVTADIPARGFAPFLVHAKRTDGERYGKAGKNESDHGVGFPLNQFANFTQGVTKMAYSNAPSISMRVLTPSHP